MKINLVCGKNVCSVNPPYPNNGLLIIDHNNSNPFTQWAWFQIEEHNDKPVALLSYLP